MVLGKIITNLHAEAGSRTRVFMEIKLELVITPVTLLTYCVQYVILQVFSKL